MLKSIGITTAMAVAAAVMCATPPIARGDDSVLQIAQSTNGSLVLYSEDEYQGTAAPFEGGAVQPGRRRLEQSGGEPEHPGGRYLGGLRGNRFQGLQAHRQQRAGPGEAGPEQEDLLHPPHSSDRSHAHQAAGRTHGRILPDAAGQRRADPGLSHGGTSKKCVQKQANTFCKDSGYKESAYFVNNEGVLEEVFCKR